MQNRSELAEAIMAKKVIGKRIADYLMSVNLKNLPDIVEYVKKNFPDCYSKMVPKEYRKVKGYFSPSVLGAIGYISAWSAKYAQTDQSMTFCTASMSLLSQNGVPVYFVQDELMEALMSAESPDIPLTSLMWPHKSINFMLPQETAKKYFGEEVVVLCISKVTGKDIMGSISVDGEPVNVRLKGEHDDCNESIMVTASKGEGDRLATYHSIHPMLPEASTKSLMRPTMKYSGIYGTSEEYFNEDKDKAILGDMVSLALNLILFMTACPTVVERVKVAVPAVTVGKKGNKKVITPSLWEPCFIGRNYTRPGRSLGGSHASPRMHFRRAHWHHYNVGPKGSQTLKVNWVERVLVNAPIDVKEK